MHGADFAQPCFPAGGVWEESYACAAVVEWCVHGCVTYCLTPETRKLKIETRGDEKGELRMGRKQSEAEEERSVIVM
jgi:hypothetical protein